MIEFLEKEKENLGERAKKGPVFLRVGRQEAGRLRARVAR